MALRKVVLIAGPTASGKSGLAIEMAKNLNGVIINADSMQVYDVLQEITARPGIEDMEGVEHLLFGHVDPREPYSVAIWLSQVKAAIDRAVASGKTPILVGGTGLYFKAALEGLSNVPPVDADIRRELREASLVDLEPLYKDLMGLDPETAGKLEPTDTQRIVRALEVVKSTGRTLAEWQGQQKDRPVLAGFDCDKVVLLPERPVLHERIAIRFKQMVERGAIDEVKALLALDLHSDMPAMRAIGVSQLGQYLRDEIDLDEAIDLSIVATRQYAKRQTTWFRHQFDEHWRVINP